MDFKTVDNSRGTVECFCLVKNAERKTSSRGDAYLDMTLSDKTGEINAKLWSYAETLHGEYAANDVVKVRGTVSPYNGVDQLRIEQIRHVTDSDGVCIDDLVQSAEYSGKQMFDELVGIAENFCDRELSALVTTLYRENEEKLVYFPAAYKLHHAIRGGLLFHTLSIVRLAQSVCTIYPFINSELLISGAMLHDIAKTREFDVSDAGLASGYSVRGNLIGHLADGAMMIDECAKRIGVSENTAMMLEHMVLSHHGEPEFGAAVRPSFIEAEILSELDLMDARIYEMREATDGVNVGEFTGKLWALDNRKLYNYSDFGNDKNTKLF